MEKAWAKLHGSYAKIFNDGPLLYFEAFRDLTGAPSFIHKSNSEQAFEKIIEAKKKDHLIIAYSAQVSNDNQKRILDKLGLHPKFGYAIKGTTVVRDKERTQVQIVNLRNPWKTFQWNP